jgi:hypothetical protein
LILVFAFPLAGGAPGRRVRDSGARIVVDAGGADAVADGDDHVEVVVVDGRSTYLDPSI